MAALWKERKGCRMQKILKKLVTVLILVNVCFFAYPIQTKAVSNLTASNFAELLTALSDSDTDIHITLTGFFDLTTTITIPAGKNVTIDGNHYNLKRGDGVTGDLITVESTATLTLEEVTIHGNKNNVPDADGSLILVDGILNLNSYAILINNYSGSKAGGGVHVNQSGTLNINDGVVCYNKSNSYGGGIYVAGAFNMNGGAVQNNDNSGSNTTVDGGGIYFSATASAATIANAQIYENSTTSSGGGFASYGAGLTITNTKIYDNHAITGAGFAIMQAGPSSLSGGSEVTGNIASDSSHTSGNGGGIYVGTNQSLTIDGALISGNTADVAGGGILNNGHLTIENAEITNNTSRMLGGGIASTIEMDFKAGTISGNHAVLGGGIYFTSNSSQIVNITGGTISENDAQYGGGIYIQNDSTVTISNVLLTKNTASDHGGGIFLTSTLSSNLVITDSTISFNKAETAGGGIGVPASDRNEVHIGSGVVFSDNCIKGQAYDINPADQATYESLVDQGTTWSKPMTQGYNNIDIEYEDGDPVEVVYFETNGGGSIDPQKVVPGGLATKPTDPVKANWYFSGWYSDNTLNNKYDFATPVAGTIVLYAKWVDNEDDIDYLVKFDSNGGSSVASQAVLRNTHVTKPVDPTKSSVFFSGWYSDQGLTTKYDFNLPVTSDMTLYAKWVSNEASIDYLVSFVTNGGSAVSSQTVIKGGTASKPVAPTYPSKYFSGWYSDQGLTTKYDFTTPVTADITLYAKWVDSEAEIDYLVRFESNGGSAVVSQAVLRNAHVTKPSDPTKSSVFFSGWYSDQGLTTKYDFNLPVTNDMTLYAKWVSQESSIDYLVSFVTNGGSAVSSQTVIKGGTASKPVAPTYPSKYFSGWYSDDTLNNKYDFDTPVTADITLYAKWVDSEAEIDYLVKFNSNGGSIVPSQTVVRDALVSKPTDPTKSSMFFSGWYSDQGLTTKYDFNTPVTSDMTLYAKWVS
ncbi:MAG: InlB B-repeat-containing protein, partial [Erysipelotrichaceae bacterium]|nr:InlB B-repeat-containing protein [Erysipelotrichaceae bacterium]